MKASRLLFVSVVYAILQFHAICNYWDRYQPHTHSIATAISCIIMRASLRRWIARKFILQIGGRLKSGKIVCCCTFSFLSLYFRLEGVWKIQQHRRQARAYIFNDMLKLLRTLILEHSGLIESCLKSAWHEIRERDLKRLINDFDENRN